MRPRRRAVAYLGGVVGAMSDGLKKNQAAASTTIATRAISMIWFLSIAVILSFDETTRLASYAKETTGARVPTRVWIPAPQHDGRGDKVVMLHPRPRDTHGRGSVRGDLGGAG